MKNVKLLHVRATAKFGDSAVWAFFFLVVFLCGERSLFQGSQDLLKVSRGAMLAAYNGKLYEVKVLDKTQNDCGEEM